VKRLQSKAAVITGGSIEIGLATADRFCTKGAKIMPTRGDDGRLLGLDDDSRVNDRLPIAEYRLPIGDAHAQRAMPWPV